jgi:hypothetical protein
MITSHVILLNDQIRRYAYNAMYTYPCMQPGLDHMSCYRTTLKNPSLCLQRYVYIPMQADHDHMSCYITTSKNPSLCLQRYVYVHMQAGPMLYYYMIKSVVVLTMLHMQAAAGCEWYISLPRSRLASSGNSRGCTIWKVINYEI